MSLLFMDSFDAGDFAAKWLQTGGTYTSVTTTPFSAGRALHKAANSVGTLSRPITPSATVVVGFWFHYNTLDPGFPAGIMGLLGDGNLTEHLWLSTGAVANQLTVKRGGMAGTTIATINGVTYAWHFCEIKATIHDTTGSVEVRIDNVVAATFTGDTRNAGTSMLIDAIRVNGSYNNTSCNIMLKDLYVLDTAGSRLNDFLGPRRIFTVVGAGAGASTALTPSVAPNWSCTEELPVTQTEYVTGVPGNKDTYDVSDLPVSAGSVDAVQVNVFARRTDASLSSVKPVLRSSGADYAPSAGVLGIVDTTTRAVFETDPATSAVWTISGVNAIQHGVEVA